MLHHFLLLKQKNIMFPGAAILLVIYNQSLTADKTYPFNLTDSCPAPERSCLGDVNQPQPAGN